MADCSRDTEAAMSKESVAKVRAGYEAFSRRDLDAALADIDPEVEWHQSSVFPDARTFHGHEGVRQFFNQVFDLFDESDFIPEEIIDLGEHIVVVHRFVGRGQGSRVPVELNETSVWTLREGKAIRQEAFATRAEALDAVELREQPRG
jgi:ketosteroid isomerase-like protein